MLEAQDFRNQDEGSVHVDLNHCFFYCRLNWSDVSALFKLKLCILLTIHALLD